MGNAFRNICFRCTEKCMECEPSIADLPSSFFMSDSSLSSYDSRLFDMSSCDPSVLSFQTETKPEHVYIDGDVCAICLDKYDDVEHIPIILPCGHTFCVLCMRVLAKKKRYKSLRCPVDRLKHDLKIDRDNMDLTQANMPHNLDHLHILPRYSVHEREDIQGQIVQGRTQTNVLYIGDWLQSISSTDLSALPSLTSQREAWIQNETLDSIEEQFTLDANRSEPVPDYTPPSSICSFNHS